MLVSKIKGQAISLSVFVLAAVSTAYAQTNGRTESSWTDLTTQPSRGQLFEQYSRKAGRALPSAFRFPHDAIYDLNGTLRQDAIFGIDISHYEGSAFPLSELAGQKVSFIYMKATQETDSADKTFDHNWKTVGSLPEGQKIPRGAFHFLSSNPQMTGAAQADSFVDYVNLHGKWQDDDLLPAVDLEWDKKCKACLDRWQTRHRTPDQIIGTTLDFLAQVKRRIGRTPIIYTNKSFLKDNHITSADQIDKLTKGHKVWIFDLDSRDRAVELPNPNNNLSHVLWQFSFGAKLSLPNYSGSFDADVFKGKPEAFKDALQGTD